MLHPFLIPIESPLPTRVFDGPLHTIVGCKVCAFKKAFFVVLTQRRRILFHGLVVVVVVERDILVCVCECIIEESINAIKRIRHSKSKCTDHVKCKIIVHKMLWRRTTQKATLHGSSCSLAFLQAQGRPGMQNFELEWFLTLVASLIRFSSRVGVRTSTGKPGSPRNSKLCLIDEPCLLQLHPTFRKWKILL